MHNINKLYQKKVIRAKKRKNEHLNLSKITRRGREEGVCTNANDLFKNMVF